MEALKQEGRRERLDARVTAEEKQLFSKAASLAGMTLSGFVVTQLRTAAQRVIREHESISLSSRDQETLVSALLEENPQPNEALQRAARAHDACIKRE